MSKTILSLPNEILNLIFDQICIASELPGYGPRRFMFSLRLETYKISCTCRRFYKLLLPRLYFDSHIIWHNDDTYFRFERLLPQSKLEVQRDYEGYCNNGMFVRTLNVICEAVWDGDYKREIAHFKATTPRWLQLNILDLLILLLPRFNNLKRVQFSHSQINSSSEFNTIFTAIKRTVQRCTVLKELAIYLDVSLDDEPAMVEETEKTVMDYPHLDKLSISVDIGVWDMDGADQIRIEALEALCELLWPAAESAITFHLRCEIYDIIVSLTPDPDRAEPRVAFPQRSYKLPRVKQVEINQNATSVWVLQNWFVIEESKVQTLVLLQKKKPKEFSQIVGRTGYI
ncbi:hypothetical protein TWF694_006535 [Orbilia ellipsospora]|uniref:F-box domain-containing protein n=1 Tax=Orbilia ellipsospora TaxID=2528407 RepID=A0AAV9XKD2_9PEZI